MGMKSIKGPEMDLRNSSAGGGGGGGTFIGDGDLRKGTGNPRT